MCNMRHILLKLSAEIIDFFSSKLKYVFSKPPKKVPKPLWCFTYICISSRLH